MESHPAHIVLPQKAPAEAMDALRWCYAGEYTLSHLDSSLILPIECLLPSHKAGPQLFAPQECQELMGLLRSAGEDLTRPSIVHTRIVSRVLLRKGVPVFLSNSSTCTDPEKCNGVNNIFGPISRSQETPRALDPDTEEV